MNTIAAIMAEQHLVARPKPRRRNLTMPDKSARKAPDLLNRDFSPPPEPNTVWVGDLTEIPCEQGRFYLATVLDLHSRRVVGFAMGARHDAALATAALQVAIAVRGVDVAGVIFHSDQGGEGGFKWSSQHPDRGVCHGKTSGLDNGDDGQAGVAVAGPSGRERAPGGAAAVLAADR
ncbi:DDE-type integrase/transposase/recombinase [Actinoplanes sichuanensis]|nr:DDE-type integrase/transposase/recombinase [Actinoplanes sichuanensis]